jgi:poly-gamma-glutamate synthesis protein (capsule biosynthesis protein)
MSWRAGGSLLEDHGLVTLCLAGDVMTGRGIDQILPHPGDPALRESCLDTARAYVELAEEANGPVPAPVPFSYPWGAALAALERYRPAVSIVNLETSITTSNDFWPGKEVHYRMHPENVGCLCAARLDVCTLANNHVLDFGEAGLLDTLDALRAAEVKVAGAGRNLDEACAPARVSLDGRASVAVYGFGTPSSGILPSWGAMPSRSGVWLLSSLSAATADRVVDRVRRDRRPGDVTVASVHWGGNWGYDVSEEERDFAHRLVEGGVDVVHGHSSHHVRPVEVWERKLILYGCGDLLTDYEGIRGFEEWRGDLGALYLATVSVGDGALVELRLVPTRVRGMRLTRPAPADVTWLAETLRRISRPFGVSFAPAEDGTLVLRAVTHEAREAGTSPPAR